MMCIFMALMVSQHTSPQVQLLTCQLCLNKKLFLKLHTHPRLSRLNFFSLSIFLGIPMFFGNLYQTKEMYIKF